MQSKDWINVLRNISANAKSPTKTLISLEYISSLISENLNDEVYLMIQFEFHLILFMLF